MQKDKIPVPDESDPFEEMLLRHTCRVAVEELRAELRDTAWTAYRRERRNDLLRYAAAACLAVAIVTPFSLSAQNTMERHPSSMHYDFRGTVSQLEVALINI